MHGLLKRNEVPACQEPVDAGESRFELLQKKLPLRCQFITSGDSDEQVVFKHVTQSSQSPRRGRLTQEETAARARNVPFLGKHFENHEEVQISLA